MILKTPNQRGFHALALVFLVVALGFAGFVGYTVFRGKQPTKDASSTAAEKEVYISPEYKPPQYVPWGFDGTTWRPSGKVTYCEDPLSIRAPIDLTRATSQLYPGQFRGGDYKAHGGLAMDGAPTGDIEVVAIRDAYLYQGSRYIEGGEVQYMLDFLDPCGIRYRYDHLAVLTPDIMNAVNQLPAPQPDDSRTHSIKPVLVTAKTVIATSVGHPSTKNFGFDIGLYDLRKPNKASATNDEFLTDQRRISKKEQSFYGLCWYEYLSDANKKIMQSLPPRNRNEAVSDYCRF